MNVWKPFRSIPNALDYFFYDGTPYMRKCDRKGKGYAQVLIDYYPSYVVKLLMNMTSFKEVAKEYDTYGDNSSDEE